MTKNALRVHSATLIAIAVVGASVLVGCQAWSDAPAAATSSKAAAASAKVEAMSRIRFFGDDFPEAYRALVDQPLAAAPSTF